MTAAYYLQLEDEVKTMAKGPEITVHTPKPDLSKKGPDPLPEDEQYVLSFAFPTDVSGHPMKAGDPVGKLTLKYGFTPEHFADLLGRGVVADKVKKKK